MWDSDGDFVHAAGPTQKPQINAVGNPGEFFGTTEFGFSKRNELFVGASLAALSVASILCLHHFLAKSQYCLIATLLAGCHYTFFAFCPTAVT